jgi:hypothetical protein
MQEDHRGPEREVFPPAGNKVHRVAALSDSLYGGSSSCYGEGNLGVLYFLLCFPKCPTWGTLWPLLPLGGFIE